MTVCFLAVVLATGAMYVFSEGGQVQWKSSGSHPIPRVLLITVDTLRQDSVGAFSGSSLTPNIDRLASESFSFPQAFTTAVNDQFPDVVDRARTLLSERERLRDAWLAGAGALVQPPEELPTQVREELESIGYLP